MFIFKQKPFLKTYSSIVSVSVLTIISYYTKAHLRLKESNSARQQSYFKIWSEIN